MLIPKKYQTIGVASVLVVASLVILSVSLHSPGETYFFRKIVLEISSPAVDAINTSIEGVRNVWKRYLFLVGLEEENRILRGRIAQLTKGLNDYRELYYEERRLRGLAGLKESAKLPGVFCRVIDRNNSYLFKTIMLNKGTSDGLRVGLPVVSAEGVVGRIVEASWNVSKVLLVVDYNSNIDVVTQESRVQGILQGGGNAGCSLKYVERSEDVKIGEQVLTSGLGGVFPKGLIVGTVLNVDRNVSGLFLKVEVMPAVRFSRLEEVFVVTPEKEKVQ